MSRPAVLESLLGSLSLAVWMLVLRGPGRAASDAPAGTQSEAKPLVVDELVVKRLRVVEEDGKDRIVLTSASRCPKPRIGGKEYPRSIAPAGILFYRANGDECGGVALVDSPQGTGNMMILDYANVDGIGFGVHEGEGSYSAGLTIRDRPPLDTDPMKAYSLVKDRVAIANDNGKAVIALADPKGRARIELAVDADGTPSFRILDEDGKALFEAP